MLKITILTPEWNREVEADAIFLPGALGEFEVLVNHAPIISVLGEGTVKWRIGETLETLHVKGGAVRLKDNEMKLCVEV